MSGEPEAGAMWSTTPERPAADAAGAARPGPGGRLRSVAAAVRPLVTELVGPEPPVRFRFWDGSELGRQDARATLVVRSPDAIRRLVYRPDELGLARAYVAGELDLEGDIFHALSVRDHMVGPTGDFCVGLDRGTRLEAVRALWRLGALGLPPRPPAEEARLRGGRHSRARDAGAIAHHYDVSNDFYRLVLDETLTYSCAYFADPGVDLAQAQRAKYELICRKLGLRPGMRLLDVGCGWGGMVLHAAEHHGVRAVGVTISPSQQELAVARVRDAGLADRVEIRLQDYRDVDDGPYDAISSIGMFEHVGLARLGEYFASLRDALRPEGRLLNHAISRPFGSEGYPEDSFVQRYVFPDGELHEVGRVVTAMQEHGLEVRDVESLREHYAITLRRWVANLEANWSQAQRLVGPARARVWRLFMAAYALSFEANRVSVHQVLAVRPTARGRSAMPLTREWLASPERAAG